MQKLNEDCFYFLTSSCAKGSTCLYRHNPAVLTCNVICPAWLRGNCIDPACLLRHSTVQRPVISNGISCFYENTSMGCLKPDCTFIHLRPRPNLRNPSILRPSTTNLVNRDAIRPVTATNPPSIPNTTPNDSISKPEINSSQIPLPVETPSSSIETETVSNQITVPSENEQTESSNRTVIADSSEKIQDDTKSQSRMVVIAESPNIPNRKVVHGTTNRVVVSSEKKSSSNDTDSDIDLDDLIEQENTTRKTNSLIDIPFPCSAPSITNRLFMSTKQSPPRNDTKPIRLNRDRLPAAKITGPKPISAPSNGEQTSAGTGLSQDDDRRTIRIERFKKKAISPPRSVVNSLSPSTTTTATTTTTPTRNIINSPPNERKRPISSEQPINDSPPSKRSTFQQENNHHNNNSTTIGDLCSPPSSSRRTQNRHHNQRRRRSSSSSQRKSPPRQAYSSTSSMNDSAWNREVDEFLAKTTQPKMLSPQPVPLLSLRPRYIPPLIQQPMIPRYPSPSQRPRQPTSVPIKRLPTPVIAPSQTPAKPIEQPPSNNTPPIQTTTTTTTTPPTIPKDDDEDKLLGLDEPTDDVETDTFIDEVLLLETDPLELE